MDWNYEQPVKIRFGQEKRKEVAAIAEELQVKRGILIAGPHLVKNGLAKELVEESNG